MQHLIDFWKTYLHGDKLNQRIADFLNADREDKRCIIAETFGVFDSVMRGNVFTYWFWYDTNDAYYATPNWRKGAKVVRVDYNWETDKLNMVHLKRWNRKATENFGRSL